MKEVGAGPLIAGQNGTAVDSDLVRSGRRGLVGKQYYVRLLATCPNNPELSE